MRNSTLNYCETVIIIKNDKINNLTCSQNICLNEQIILNNNNKSDSNNQ